MGRVVGLDHQGRADGVLPDNICSSTQSYSDALASFRPPSAHPPVAGSGGSAAAGAGDRDGLDPSVVLGVSMAAVALTAAFSGWGLRARRVRAS